MIYSKKEEKKKQTIITWLTLIYSLCSKKSSSSRDIGFLLLVQDQCTQTAQSNFFKSRPPGRMTWFKTFTNIKRTKSSQWFCRRRDTFKIYQTGSQSQLAPCSYNIACSNCSLHLICVLSEPPSLDDREGCVKERCIAVNCRVHTPSDLCPYTLMIASSSRSMIHKL